MSDEERRENFAEAFAHGMVATGRCSEDEAEGLRNYARFIWPLRQAMERDPALSTMIQGMYPDPRSAMN